MPHKKLMSAMRSKKEQKKFLQQQKLICDLDDIQGTQGCVQICCSDVPGGCPFPKCEDAVIGGWCKVCDAVMKGHNKSPYPMVPYAYPIVGSSYDTQKPCCSKGQACGVSGTVVGKQAKTTTCSKVDEPSSASAKANAPDRHNQDQSYNDQASLNDREKDINGSVPPIVSELSEQLKSVSALYKARLVEVGISVDDEALGRLLESLPLHKQDLYYMGYMRQRIIEPFTDWLDKCNSRLQELMKSIIRDRIDIGEHKIKILKSFRTFAIVAGRKTYGTPKNSRVPVSLKDIGRFTLTRVDYLMESMGEELKGFSKVNEKYCSSIAGARKTLRAYNIEWKDQLKTLKTLELDLKNKVAAICNVTGYSCPTMTEDEIRGFTFIGEQHFALNKQILAFTSYKEWMDAHMKETGLCEKLHLVITDMVSGEARELLDKYGSEVAKMVFKLEQTVREENKMYKSSQSSSWGQDFRLHYSNFSEILDSIRMLYDNLSNDDEAQLLKQVVTRAYAQAEMMAAAASSKQPGVVEDDDGDEGDDKWEVYNIFSESSESDEETRCNVGQSE